MEKSSEDIVRSVTWRGAGVNLMLAAVKTGAGVLTGSQALLADGFHSLSDLLTDGAVIIGSRFWSADYDEKHPYGHRRIETLITLFIAAVLAVAACGIGWNALTTLHDEHKSMMEMPVFLIAVLSIATKEILYRWTLRKGSETGSSALIANAWHHRSDALSSVPVALAAVAGYFFPDLNYFDHVAALIISAMLLKASWDIAVPCINEVLDVQADIGLSAVLEEIRKAEPEICEFHKIRSRHCGSAVFVDLHMLVKPEMTVADSHALTRKVERNLKDACPAVKDVTIHVEPEKR